MTLEKTPFILPHCCYFLCLKSLSCTCVFVKCGLETWLPVYMAKTSPCFSNHLLRLRETGFTFTWLLRNLKPITSNHVSIPRIWQALSLYAAMGHVFRGVKVFVCTTKYYNMNSFEETLSASVHSYPYLNVYCISALRLFTPLSSVAVRNIVYKHFQTWLEVMSFKVVCFEHSLVLKYSTIVKTWYISDSDDKENNRSITDMQTTRYSPAVVQVILLYNQ